MTKKNFPLQSGYRFVGPKMMINIERLEEWDKKEIEHSFNNMSKLAVSFSKKLNQKQYKSLYQHSESPMPNDSDYPEARQNAEEDAKLRVSAMHCNICWSDNAWREYLIHYGVCLEKFKDQG